jgi:hypothetical protein
MQAAKVATNVFLLLVAASLLVSGVLWAIAPTSNLATNGISVSSALGMNMIKTDIGAPLITTALFLVIFVFKRGHWFYPAAMNAAAYLVIRIISFAVDGYHPMVAVGIALEATVLAVLFAARRIDAVGGDPTRPSAPPPKRTLVFN